MLRSDRSPVRRAAVITTVTAIGLLALAGPAWAHITVSPDTAAKGGSDLEVTFRVPNEEDKAATTKVEITFPTDHPIASVLAQPEPGWNVQVDNTTLATPLKTDDGTISQVVSKITWTGGQIAPGQYKGFHAIFGKLPGDADQLVFKAVQTYGNGDVVRWIDLTQPGKTMPDHPAPVLNLSKAAGGSSDQAKPAKATVSAAKSSSDSTARGLGIGGLIVGVLGLLAGAYALVSARRRISEATSR